LYKEYFAVEFALSEEPTALSLLHTLRNLRIIDKEGQTKKLTTKYIKLNVKNTQVICEKKERVSN
jgi:hypothetical protein